MRTCRKYIGLFLVLVYAFFFASTNFFYHSHQLASSRLVHSHPFNGQGHSHTANQIVLINIVDSSIYQESTGISVPDIVSALPCRELALRTGENVSSCSVFSFSLRAPPAIS